MDKEVVKRLLAGGQIQLTDLTLFVHDYVREEKDYEPTPQQINEIIKLIQMGAFNLRVALDKAAHKLGLTILNVFDKNGQLIKTISY